MCTERYVNPFTDFGFKLLFGTQANREFLIAFLNSILDCKQPIVDISYNNTEVFGKSAEDRKAVYDLYCETADGSHIIVEMQNAYQRYFMDRTIYYSSFLMQAASRRGEWDYRLPEVYSVAFLNFNMDDYVGDPSYKHVVRLMDVDTKKVFFDKLTYIYLEMPKFNKDVTELHDSADYWLFLIKNLAVLDNKPESFRDKVYERFFRTAEIAKFTPEQRVAYETSLKIMRDYNNTVNSAKYKGHAEGLAEGRAEGLAEGRAEGLAEGRAEGLAEGRAEGLAEGRAEGLAEGRAEGIAEGIEKGLAQGKSEGIQYAMVQIARVLKSQGMAPIKIAEVTGLTESEISQI